MDDHPLVIEGIQQMLSLLSSVEVCGYAMNASSCLGYFVKNNADVVLLDINLPGTSGIEVCKALKSKDRSPSVIALTNFEQLTYLENMREAGANGYLLKNCSLTEIEAAINAVISGKEYWLGKDSIRESMKEFNAFLLTRRELEVLKSIALGLTNPEIASKLFVSNSTIDSHRKNLLAKFGVRNTAALVRIAIEKKII